MPFVPMNVILDKVLPGNALLSLPYPQGKGEGHFFGGLNHTLSVDGGFFRSPRDFTIVTQPDRIVLNWHGGIALPAGALLNFQLEMPGGDFYHDSRTGVTVHNMVTSPLFMINLTAPEAPNDRFWLDSVSISEVKALKPLNSENKVPRNITLSSTGDNTQCVFTVEGEDVYRRTMVEKLFAPASGMIEGKKAFARLHKITPSHPCNGEISMGTGNRFGLPVFLPGPAYILREIINGMEVTGSTVISGETGLPSATSGDRRGTYTPPSTVPMDGKHSIHLLLSLPVPGNIGIPDYAG